MSQSNKRTTIKSLTLVNFKGIFFKTLSMHHLMSNLIGHNGAGKTTVMGALLINRVPDNRLIRLRNNSDSGSDRSDNGVWGRIDQGVCYTVVDYERYDGKRVIAVVQLKRLGKPRVEIKLSAINGIDHDIPVRDLLMKPTGEGRYEPIEGKALKGHIARLGGTLENFKSLGLYMAWQFENRILPRRMDSSQDRQRYYRMLETSLYGGLSSELQKSLRDYLLPSDSNVRTSVSSMQNALQETRNTRQQIDSSRGKREFIKNVLESSYTLGENTLALAEQRHTRLQQQLRHTRQQQETLKLELEGGQQQIDTLEHQLEQLNTTRDQLSQQEHQTRTRLDQSRELERLHSEQEQLTHEITNLREFLKEQHGHQSLLKEQKARQMKVVTELDEDLNGLVKQLSDAKQAYSEELRKAGLYQEAIRSLDESRLLLNEPSLDSENLARFVQDITTERESLQDSYFSQKPMLEQMELIRQRFDQAQAILRSFLCSSDDTAEQTITDDKVAHAADQWLNTGREKRQLASKLPLYNQQHRNLKQQFQRRHSLINEIKRLPESWQGSLKSTDSWLTTLAQASEQQAEQTALKETCDFQLQDNRVREMQLRNDLKRAIEDHRQWSNVQQLSDAFLNLLPEQSLTRAEDLTHARQTISSEQLTLNRLDVEQEEQLKTTRNRLRGLEQLESEDNSQLQRLAELTGGEIVSRYFDDDDISIEEAAWLEAKMGPLRQALMVRNIEAAAAIIRSEAERPEHVWLMQGAPGNSFSEDDFINAPLNQPEDGCVLVTLSDNIARISKEPEFPTIGRLARKKERQRLIDLEEELLDKRQALAVRRKQLQQASEILDKLAAVGLWLGKNEPPVRKLEEQLQTLENTLHSLTHQQNQLQQQLNSLLPVIQFLEYRQSDASLLELDQLEEQIGKVEEQLELANTACEWLKHFDQPLNQLEQLRLYLDKPPVADVSQLRQQLNDMQLKISLLGKQKDQLQNTEQKLPYLRFKESESRKHQTSDLQQQIRQEWEEKDSRKRFQQQELDQLSDQLQALDKNIATDEEIIKRNEGQILLKQNQANGIPLEWSPNLVDEHQEALEQLLSRKDEHDHSAQTLSTTLADQKLQQKQREEQASVNDSKLATLEPASQSASQGWAEILQHAQDTSLYTRLYKQHLQENDADLLVNHIANARAALQNALKSESHSTLYQQIRDAETSNLPLLFHLVSATQVLLNERMDKSLATADDPLQALNQLEEHLTKLETRLADAECRFLTESDSMGRNIEQKINMQRRQIMQLNSALSSVHFGTIRAIKVELEVIETHEKVLNALQNRFYGDLFKQSDLSIEDALAEVFKKETGGSITGERLLDYREYIRLKVLIKRAGSTQFEPANPTNLSTGEAIGTGLAVLTMVLHSWEVATQRNHQKGHCANRLLFLDEAARLDARALATLEELCENQSLQLLIGAPDNVQPKNGVTYRMVRLMEPREHVIFSAVRGKLPTGEAA
ncbi:chromosome partition protein MukB [Endozoicomonas gorgoniicola]|uniref:Chromosome partition protein MukB n=1 Tax=Endozoicomonas gorgoniicola TaxID=1234144 RepID=A0ABT3MS75_9GAMM|nr:chromosome partition protein MukB [Endozoicomonas gorgoniicola]MCW7552228.1 chromosome partition protein MukB [Endozoicomonas gorgoniicola]